MSCAASALYRGAAFCFSASVDHVGVSLASLSAPIPLSIIMGLFVGRQVGVFGASLAALKLGVVEWLTQASLGASRRARIFDFRAAPIFETDSQRGCASGPRINVTS
jgi:Na+/H+ antiporter 1